MAENLFVKSSGFLEDLKEIGKVEKWRSKFDHTIDTHMVEMVQAMKLGDGSRLRELVLEYAVEAHEHRQNTVKQCSALLTILLESKGKILTPLDSIVEVFPKIHLLLEFDPECAFSQPLYRQLWLGLHSGSRNPLFGSKCRAFLGYLADASKRLPLFPRLMGKTREMKSHHDRK